MYISSGNTLYMLFFCCIRNGLKFFLQGVIFFPLSVILKYLRTYLKYYLQFWYVLIGNEITYFSYISFFMPPVVSLQTLIVSIRVLCEAELKLSSKIEKGMLQQIDKDPDTRQVSEFWKFVMKSFGRILVHFFCYIRTPFIEYTDVTLKGFSKRCDLLSMMP